MSPIISPPSYDADQSSSLFLWSEKEKEKQKQSKKRKSGEERTKHSLTFLEDEDSNLTVNLDVKENIQNFSQNSQEKLIPVLTNKEVIGTIFVLNQIFESF